MSFFFQMTLSGIKSKRFYIALSAILFAMSFSWVALREDSISLFECSYLQAFLHGCFGWSTLLPALAPLIAAVPFAAQHVENCKSGAMKYMVARMGQTKYFNTMFFINICLTALAFIVGMALFFIICLIFFGGNVNIDSLDSEFPNIYSQLALRTPFLYVIVLIAHCSFVSVAFSSIGYCVSFFIKNKFAAWISGFIITILMALFALFLNVVALEPMSIFDVCRCSTTTHLLVICYVLAVVGLAYLISKIKFNRAMKNDEEI